MQVWQTPFLSDAYAAAQPAGTGPLERIGNADLVRGHLRRAVDRPYGGRDDAVGARSFEALIAACDRAFDHYFWLARRTGSCASRSTECARPPSRCWRSSRTSSG